MTPNWAPLGSATVANPKLWSVESPSLYDVVFELRRGAEVLDRVHSYFGFRSVGAANGRFTLNGKPTYLKLLLDQLDLKPDAQQALAGFVVKLPADAAALDFFDVQHVLGQAADLLFALRKISLPSREEVRSRVEKMMRQIEDVAAAS